MITQTSTKEELLTAIGEAVSDMGGLIQSIDESQVNKVPYEGSWTAGQLFNHVTKSIGGMSGAMSKETKPADRDPGEKINNFRETFLNFSTKMQSPDIVVPDAGPFKKGASIQALNDAFENMKKPTLKANLSELITGLPMGDVTKLELLHFVVYHTQRHLHQLKKISDALLSK